ncbi:Transcription factor GTE10 [Abeliophyllum distichum]|uniref:Transcription factor GTE10 n=1 Tax=Abeliophyllum distichum TaxID=126358 RepID=A0ABD1RV25_9LAMI
MVINREQSPPFRFNGRKKQRPGFVELGGLQAISNLNTRLSVGNQVPGDHNSVHWVEGIKKVIKKRGCVFSWGKQGKLSKGCSSGFVRDYRYSVGAMPELEGFGSSDSVDTKSTFPEDSFAPQKKSISLNVDGFDRSVVPTQVFSLSRISHLGRRDLDIKLRNELEQVRMLQKKIALLSSNATSDMHSYGDVPKRPAKLQTCLISVNKVSAVPGKKKNPLGRNVPRMNDGAMAARQIDFVKKHSLHQNLNSVTLMKQCETLLNRLMTQKNALIFNSPVDIVAFNIPDYFNVIKHPMDLGTIKTKLLSGRYSRPEEFAADVRLTFKNAMTYNPPGHHVHHTAEKMNKHFEVRWKQIEKKIPVTMDASVTSKAGAIMEAKTPSMPPSKKQKTTFTEKKVKQEPVKPLMSNVEKRKLEAELKMWLEEFPEDIINFLKESTLNGSQVNEDEITIDLDTLSDDTLFKLRKLLDDNVEKKQSSQVKIEPFEIEICNESGYSNSHVHSRKAEKMNKLFEVRWKQIEKKIPVTMDASMPSKAYAIMEAKTTSMPPPKKQETTFTENKVKQERVKPLMSNVEKRKLEAELETWLEELPEDIINFLKESTLNGSQVNEDGIAIDLDTLSDDTLFKLRKLLDDYVEKKQKSQAKMEPFEIEICNESGYSNSHVQPHKGNEPTEKDVDIARNDTPISSFPHVEIDKDAARIDSQCRSSSSSSNSDSGNCSDSESDGVKDSVPASSAKETIVSGVEEENDLDDVNTRDFLNGLTMRNSPLKCASVEPSCCLGGESAPPERQVSPGKLYRAALLRSRFADIIIKAQENTFEKGERQDPEKLKLEREEFERQRREEKARLIEEVKAAEVSQKKAEAEAAAEARRKRELEREAARQALQKMEKTVDINDNSQYMEYLEIFRAAPDDNLQGSSNPLEQLGLYMKMDGEEEETVPQDKEAFGQFSRIPMKGIKWGFW